ncbi:ABC transporter substrate-binding protein [Paenibacillus tundrae]|uniref:Multiple sugar transport system substrate-binding protein n=1 Tax=Paenibacillus tundrae TaxID=528187 RepID=A0ABT9WDJ7_9BACL|nr:sugar ABC transporter substrate-binding protein [Paenibacillus tundrae]MDQ0170895.1 multiple sugar transport system substrate-binding protein [Paenibacillus tundrae]
MAKKWIMTTLSALLALSLAGCSTNNGTTASTGTGGSDGKSTEGKTKVIYWTPDRHDADFMKTKIDEFNKTNKDNIEVEMTVMGDNYPQAVDIAFASKQAPDVLQVNDFQTYYQKGYLAPIDGYMSEDMKTTFKDSLIDNKNTIDGKIYTLPNTGQVWRLVYNKDIFQKAGITSPPKTLTEMVEDAKKITNAGKSEGIYGFASPFKSGSGFWRAANTIAGASNNYGIDGYNYRTGQFDFGMYKDVALALRQMSEDGSMLPGVESLDIDPLRAQFAQGKIGMYINHSSEPGVYKDQFPTEENWAAAPVPTSDGTIKGASQVIGGSYIGISADSTQKEAAWKFMAYVYSKDLQSEYYEKGYGISLIPAVLSSGKKPSIPGIEGFLPKRYDAIFPANPGVVTESSLEGTKWTDAFSIFVFTGGDIDNVIKDLDSRYNAALEKTKAAGLTNISADPSFDSSKLQGKLSTEE